MLTPHTFSPLFSVVVLEDEDNQYSTYSPTYARLFRQIAPDITMVRCAEKRQLHDLLTHRPHVVISDVDLGLGKTLLGLDAIADTKPAYPDVLFLAVTRKHLAVETFGVKFPNADLVVSKLYLKQSPKYHDYISSQIRDRLKRGPNVCVEIQADRQHPFERFVGRKPKLAELTSLVSQVTHTSGTFDPATSIQRAKLMPIPGGRSAAAVFALHAYASDDRALGVPGVLKISRAADTVRDIENYHRYVKWFLPYTWRVDIIGTGLAGEFGAVCYSFVHGTDNVTTTNGVEQRTVSVARLLQMGHRTIVADITNTIFSPRSQAWYAMDRPAERDLSDHYGGAPYFSARGSISEAAETLISELRSFARKAGLQFECLGERISLGEWNFAGPMFRLFSESWGSYRECICHGDLNANNIYQDTATEQLAFIDFQRTGWSHVFTDFLTLECSVRVDTGREAPWESKHPTAPPAPDDDKSPTPARNLADFVAREIQALEHQWDADTSEDSYLRDVILIRRAAHANFPEEPFANYAFGVVVTVMTLLRLSGWTELQMLRLLGGAVASLWWMEQEASARRSE